MNERVMSLSPKIRVADYIADFLVKSEIEHVFSVTGGGAMHLNDALGKKQGLACVYNHHEQACAIAAESYARLTGKIAAVCVTTGPGGTNAITGVMGGYVDSVPMLVISGQVRYDTTVDSTGMPLRQVGDQEFDIIGSVGNMTKYAVMVKEPEEIRYYLEKALFLAYNGRPGPCWLDIPLSVQSALIDPETLRGYDKNENITEIAPKVTDDIVKFVIEKLNSAKRPVVMVGSGIRLGNAHDKLLKLLESFKIPVVTAWNSHDQIADSHPLYGGRPGTVGDRGGNYVVQNSDLLLVLGCRLNIRQISYNWEMFAHSAYKIMVDIDPLEMDKPTLSIDMKIHAHIADFIDVMLRVGGTFEASPQWLDYCREINKKYPVCLPEYREKSSPVNPYVFMDSLFSAFDDDETIVTSNGSACVVSFQAGIIKEKTRLFTNSGCASMGYGLPAALGACVAAGKRVVCIEGDGSIQMNLQELQTVVHYGLPLKIVVLNNSGYHSIRQTQSNFFGQPLVGVGPDSGVGFVPFEKLSWAFGLEFFKVDSHEDMEEKISLLLSNNKAALMEVVVDIEQQFSPKLASKKLEDGSMCSPPLEDLFPFLPREEFEENIKITKI